MPKPRLHLVLPFSFVLILSAAHTFIKFRRQSLTYTANSSRAKIGEVSTEHFLGDYKLTFYRAYNRILARRNHHRWVVSLAGSKVSLNHLVPGCLHCQIGSAVQSVDRSAKQTWSLES
jgi:hypothetical protein